jgi:hypothetical protein
MYGKGADNLQVKGGSLRYSLEGAVSSRILRFCLTIRTMSEIHRLLRYAGKGSSFAFSPREAIPYSIPKPEEEKAIQLYDHRVATTQHAFHHGGTQLVDVNHSSGNEALTVHRIVPEMLQSVVGRPPNQQDVELLAYFVPQVISFQRLKELNRNPLLSGRAWIGKEATSIFVLLSVAPYFVSALNYGLTSLMQSGYLVIDDGALCAGITKILPEVTADLNELLPGQPIPSSGEIALASLEKIRGSLWPLRLGPVIRRNGSTLWVDLYAATAILDSLLEFPLTPGDAVANARAEHFEDSVQRAIDLSRWRPSPALKKFARRELRLGGRAISDIDALGARDKTLVLVSCKSLIYSAAYDAGDYQVVRNAASTVVEGVTRWQSVVASLKAQPVGDNYNFSSYESFVAVLCTPHPVYVPIGIATEYVKPGLLAAVSLEELASWLELDS